jgi:PAS domain S-box-containing protein
LQDPSQTRLLLCIDGTAPEAAQAVLAAAAGVGNFILEAWDLADQAAALPERRPAVLLVALGSCPERAQRLQRYIDTLRSAGPLVVLRVLGAVAAPGFVSKPTNALWDSTLPCDDVATVAAMLALWVRLHRAEAHTRALYVRLQHDVPLQNSAGRLAPPPGELRPMRQLEAIADALPAQVILVDADERYLFANAAHLAWCGAAEAELLGRSLAERLNDAHFPLLQYGIHAALKGAVSTVEHTLCSAENITRHFLTMWAPYRIANASGSAAPGALGYLLDIDNLRRSEREAAERQMRFTFIAEFLPAKIFTTDCDGNVNYLNATWFEYTGCVGRQGMDTSWLDYVEPTDRQAIFERSLMLPSHGQPIEVEGRLRRHDGAYRWHLFRYLILPTASHTAGQGERAGIVLDIHERKIARLKVIHDRDQHRERVDVLQKDRVERERFVATLSHDLRTPLTVARLGTERLVRQVAQDPKALRVAHRVERSILRTDAMIGDFLDVSRICAGRGLTLRRTPGALLQIVQASLEDMDPLHSSRCRLAPSDAGHGHWDNATVRRVVDNLVGNALKYGDRGTPITLCVRAAENEAILEVHNVGSPILPADRARLFAHFSRLDDAMLGNERGWGIGLTLVAGIAQAYGGTVGVDSGEGIGTTFRVVFPSQAPPP